VDQIQLLKEQVKARERMRYKEPKQWTNMFDATPATPNALDEKIESGVAD
jgi:hypothetical protein